MKLAFDGQYVLLKEIATPNARIGWQNLRSEEFSHNGDAYIITGTDFINGKVDFSTCMFVSDARYQMDKRIQVNDGDILITKDGTIGKVAFVEGLNDKKATLNAGVFILNNIDSKVVDRKYLFHYLSSPLLMKFVRSNSTGGTIQHLNQNVLVNFPIKLPTLETQKLVGAFLFAIDEKIALAERRLSCIKKFYNAYLLNLFSIESIEKSNWSVTPLGCVAKVYDGTHQTPKYTTEGVRFVSVEDISDLYASGKFISEECFENMYKTKPAVGDVLMTRIGDIGTPAIITSVPLAYYVSLALIKCGDSVDSKYIKFFIESPFFQKELWKRTIHSAFPKKINLSEISNCLIALPKKDEQILIGNKLSLIKFENDILEKKINSLKKLKQAFLQQMFV